MKFELRDHGMPTLMSIKKISRYHREVIQQGLATAMTLTRKAAAEHLIPNITGFVNPYIARKKQPSIPGRLTSRTNKLHYMLMNKVSSSNPLRSWIGFGNRLVKEKSVGLMGQIRSIGTGDKESYRATYRIGISSDSHLWDTYRGKPQESIRTLTMRFIWEYRGRPIFSPVVNLTSFTMRTQIKKRNEAIWNRRI